MTAFDTNILTAAAYRNAAVVARMLTIPEPERCVPVVAAEEIIRGRLDEVRRAQAGGKVSLPVAYAHLEDSLASLRGYQMLSYTPAADAFVLVWRTAKIRVGTRDLRIAAICIAHDITLATRNARDFAQVPGLKLEIWP